MPSFITRRADRSSPDLKKPNFAIFADGTQQTITNFSTPEAPITVAMVVEYSKWSEMFGLYGNGGYEPGTYEVIRRRRCFFRSSSSHPMIMFP